MIIPRQRHFIKTVMYPIVAHPANTNPAIQLAAGKILFEKYPSVQLARNQMMKRERPLTSAQFAMAKLSAGVHIKAATVPK